MAEPPRVVIIAGPNGAGKSTIAPRLLAEVCQITEFVNADTIARGLSAFDPARVAIQAGRIMLRRLKDLAMERADFAFETTLSTRSFAPWLGELAAAGYRIDLTFVYVASSSLAVERVAERVRAGGHFVEDETVHRRFHRSLKNLFTLYLPLASSWSILDNTNRSGPVCIASGGIGRSTDIADASLWDRIRAEALS